MNHLVPLFCLVTMNAGHGMMIFYWILQTLAAMTQSLTTNTENIDQEEVDEFPVTEVRLMIYYGVIISAITSVSHNHESSLVLLKACIPEVFREQI